MTCYMSKIQQLALLQITINNDNKATTIKSWCSRCSGVYTHEREHLNIFIARTKQLSTYYLG